MTCAAAPILQEVQGCFVPTKRTFARYAGFEFDRCPVTYQSKRTVLLMNEVGFLKELGWSQRKLPAKRIAALHYIEDFLLKLVETQKVKNG